MSEEYPKWFLELMENLTRKELYEIIWQRLSEAEKYAFEHHEESEE